MAFENRSPSRIGLNRVGLRTRTIGLLALVLVLLLAVFVWWAIQVQRESTKAELLEQTRVLVTEMYAVWEFVSINQDTINYTSSGEFDYKGLHCAIAGKSVAALFSRNSDYSIRFTNENPRNGYNEPDAYEERALRSFNAHDEVNEYYGFEEYQGEPVFRYVSAMKVTKDCIDCHGKPAGEIDITGYPKEGWETGEIAGAVSVVVPTDLYFANMRKPILNNILFFFAMTLCMAAVIVKINDVLKQEGRYKSDFLAIVSHEMRTPLTSILAFSELMAKGISPRDTVLHKQVEEIEKNSNILLEMVDNILDTARIQAGFEEVNAELIDINDIVGLVEDSSVSLAQKKSIDLATRVDADVPLIESDGEKLRRILLNLVSNAIKFTPPGGSVQVRVSYDRPAESVRIDVVDSGIGIPPDKQDMIFERFRQENMSTVRQYGGSGLGLSLVKDLVGMLGGSISLESAPGEGSTFSVAVPVGTV
ncbi:MAG: DUF3365 domain-containing protein [Eggerthellaceae bacterium]|jgi:signal transduction histidine kinase|nr:DUF3365 domain-containing protein [Eggerthellaceae bacterium]MDR2715289.1 DUF3365 domain-containing protein [Coriobacteriaceae bacterium]